MNRRIARKIALAPWVRRYWRYSEEQQDVAARILARDIGKQERALGLSPLPGGGYNPWKKLGRIRSVRLTGVWGTCVNCPRTTGARLRMPERCRFRGRSDHRLTP